MSEAAFISSSNNTYTVFSSENEYGGLTYSSSVVYNSPEFLDIARAVGEGVFPDVELGGGLSYGEGVFGFSSDVSYNPSTEHTNVHVSGTVYGVGFEGDIELDADQNIVSKSGFGGGRLMVGQKGEFLGISFGAEGSVQLGIYVDSSGISVGANLHMSMGVILGSIEYTEDYRFNVYDFEVSQCFLAGTQILLADGTEKPIEEIAPGDWVMSYDAAGRLVPGRVSRTFQKDAKHILDFFGLMVTPGHVMLCGAGRYAGRHVTLLDILRSDGAVVQADGGLIRAATGVPVGSELDAEIEVVTGTAGPQGFVVAAAGRLRMGTRAILENGADLSLAELIAANGGRRTEAGLIASAAGEGPFVWPFGPNLPQPEDYVLARSAVTLAEIYAAAEWETAPALPGPARGDLGPVGAAPAARRDKMPANLPLSMRAPNRTGLQ